MRTWSMPPIVDARHQRPGGSSRADARAARCVAALITASLVLAGCAAAPAPSDPPSMPEPTADAVRMAAVGDSITDGDSRDLAGGVPGPQSWVSYAIGPDLDFVGGWAEWGARVSQMADAVQDPLDADVLVILGGTNDATWTPREEVAADLERIVESAGVEEVVLSSIPPLDPSPGVAEDMNAFLEDVANAQGWTWVDAAAGMREGDGFAEGMSYDGVHPTEDGARVLGEAIGAAVVDAAR